MVQAAMLTVFLTGGAAGSKAATPTVLLMGGVAGSKAAMLTVFLIGGAAGSKAATPTVFLTGGAAGSKAGLSSRVGVSPLSRVGVSPLSRVGVSPLSGLQENGLLYIETCKHTLPSTQKLSKASPGNFSHQVFPVTCRYAQRTQGLHFADRYVIAECCLYLHSTIVLAENVPFRIEKPFSTK